MAFDGGTLGIPRDVSQPEKQAYNCLNHLFCAVSRREGARDHPDPLRVDAHPALLCKGRGTEQHGVDVGVVPVLGKIQGVGVGLAVEAVVFPDKGHVGTVKAALSLRRIGLYRKEGQQKGRSSNSGQPAPAAHP